MSDKDKDANIENTEDEKPRIYEIGYLLIPNLSGEEVAGSVDSIRGLVEGAEGSLISSENPKLIKLAYSMEKVKDHKKHTFEEAHFGWIKFHGIVGATLEIKNKLDANDNIIRFIIIKTTLEDTRVPKRQPVTRKPKMIEKSKTKTEKPVSEEELDKAIDELVA
ncbi:MAG TPA: 30S ribosomal protein S6 [Candidatus Yonathbacteria bacterium]|nr:30S ribosomal protein S6 [Candidatus Yonathbacteria bacterium]